MAIYHCSLRTFSRGLGHSAVAAAAYRAGAQIRDERSGRIHRYHKRTGVADTFILAPHESPKKFQDRAVLWNAAEASENRKNSRVAREVILALPHELSDKQRQALAREMALYLIERYRVAVDVAIHSPCEGEGHDPRNHHAHLLFTTREVTKEGLGAKTRILDDKVTGPQEIEIIREVWETLANDALERAGFEDIKIDRRTLEHQGVDRIPQTHIGPKAKASEDEADKGEDEQQGDKDQGGKKGSSGGASVKPEQKKGKGEDGKDGKEDEDGKSGSGDDAVALKLQSKLKKDHKGRDIDYRVIDRLKTRQNFVDEIKRLNERRAAFGDKPLKEQIADLDKLMERLDTRLERLQTIEDKTTLPIKLLELIEQAAHKAAELLGLRKQEHLFTSLHREEDKAREQRHKARYGRIYRKGIHSQITDMKASIERLETKQAEVKRYERFVEKLEKEIVKHSPSITTDKTKEPAKPVPKTTNVESSLKLKLQASAMRENLPLEDKQVQVKRPAQEQSSSTQQRPTTNTEPAAPPKDPIRLTETTRQQFEPPKSVEPKPAFERAHRTFNSQAEKLEAIRREQEDYKTKNNVVFKALERERATREPIRVERPQTREEPYRQPIKLEVKGLKAEADRRGPNFIKTQEQINTERAAAKTQTTGKFNRPEDHAPRKVSNEDVISRAKERASEARDKVPPRYRADPYSKPEEAKTEKPTRTKTQTAQSSFRESAPPRPEPKAPTPKMSAKFNTRSGFNETANDSPDQTPDDEPEAEI